LVRMTHRHMVVCPKLVRTLLQRLYIADTRCRSMMAVFLRSRALMFSVVLRNADQIRRYSVSLHTPSGWEVTTEREGQKPQRVFYRDWHRVERALALFRWEVSVLMADGWHRV